MVHPVEALTRLGGVADLATLTAVTTRGRLRSCVRAGLVVHAGHGRYALPTAHEGLRAAARVAGVASHASAASIHGWEIARPPAVPHVVVPRNRKLIKARRVGLEVRWRDLDPSDVHGFVTSATRTVLDCARDLPFPDALAIADSALRHGAVDLEHLETRALALRSNGRSEALRVVAHATPLAANPFESVLRAVALDVEGLNLEPQVWIDEAGFKGRPDLVDRRRRIIVEAESFAWHGDRRALVHDCERYNALVLRGWLVVRFAWEHVMFEPDYVRDVLTALVSGPDGRATLPPTLMYSRS